MAHGLQDTDFMFVTGDAPWHKVNYASVVEAPTAAEAMVLAHLDWRVSKVPLYYAWQDGNGVLAQAVGDDNEFLRIPGKYGMLRDDLTGGAAFLGIVGDQYTPVQNKECFAFLDALVGQGTEQVYYETAGSIWGGKRVWMLARIPRDIRIEGTDDLTKVYVLLTSAHDGSSALTAAVTPVRVVCNNTLTAALATAQRSWTVVHTGNAHEHIGEAQEALGLTLAYADEFEAAANALARRPMLAAEMKALTAALFPVDEEGEHSTRAQKARGAIEWAFDNLESCTLPGIEHSRWGAWNAVAAWADHAQGTAVKDPEHKLTDDQKAERRNENRLASIWGGSSAYIKNLAFQLLSGDEPLTMALVEREKVPVRAQGQAQLAVAAQAMPLP